MAVRCNLTNVSCEGREILHVPGNAPLWVAPSVKILLMQGKSIFEIKRMQAAFEADLGTMNKEARERFFAGSVIKVV